VILDEIGRDQRVRPFMKEEDFLDETISFENELIKIA
jgi:hypothetical protein